MNKIKPLQLTFSAVLIALGLITSAIKLVDLPLGGSATACSMMFICLIGYFFGPYVGIFSALAYGILQFAFNPYVLNIPQVICDYILAFGSLGLSGFFRKKKHGLITGYLVAVCARLFFSFLSGVIFFGEYAADYGMSAVVYSFLYNFIYLGAEAAVTVIILLLPPVKKALNYVRTRVLHTQD